MGEGRVGVNGGDAGSADAPTEREEQAIESQIVRLRGELGEIVGELDRRRHEAFDLRLQLRRHAGVVVGIGTVAVVLAVGGLALWGASRRRQERLLVRMQNLARAVAIMSRHPERLERALAGRPQPGTAVATALTKVAGAVAQRAIRA